MHTAFSPARRSQRVTLPLAPLPAKAAHAALARHACSRLSGIENVSPTTLPCRAAPRPARAHAFTWGDPQAPNTHSGTPVSVGGRGPVNAAPVAWAPGAGGVRAGLPPRPPRLPGSSWSRRTAPSYLPVGGFRPALPTPDKHVSVHPAFQPTMLLSLPVSMMYL